MSHTLQVISFRIFLLALILWVVSLVRESSAAEMISSAGDSKVATVTLCEGNSEATISRHRVKKNLVKTEIRQYWLLLEKAMGADPSLPMELRTRGNVVGDFHLQNLGLYFDLRQQRLNLMLNDYDDAGMNYLVGDLIKFLISFEDPRREKKDTDVLPKYDLQQVISSFAAGVRGDQRQEPREITLLRQKAREKPQKFDENALKYLEKVTAENQLKFSYPLVDEKAIKELADEDVDFVKSAFPQYVETLGMSIDSWGTFTEKSGSSKGMSRYQLVVSTKPTSASKLTNSFVMEFKKLKCPGTYDGKGLDLKIHQKKMRDFFAAIENLSPDLEMRQQRIRNINGSSYLQRYKTKNYLNDIADKSQELVNYYAYYLGRLQSKSAPHAQIYSDTVEKNMDLILRLKNSVQKEWFHAER